LISPAFVFYKLNNLVCLGGERVTHFGLSSEKVFFYLKDIVETFADFDRQEKKKILSEVIQKIKVNSSKDEVHLFLNLPCKISLLP
jgi:hypothetical protein